MVQTQALLTAVLALAGPTPPTEPPTEPPPEPPTEVPSAPGEFLRFAHPVQTNPYQPPAPPRPYTGNPPRRSGGGGGGGGGGMSQNPAALADTSQMNGVERGANGGLGQTLPPGWTETPTTPDETTDPTGDPLVDPTMWPESATTTPGTSPVQVDDLPPTTDEPPTANPEPGTLVLAGIGLIAGGGAVVRKWRRKR